MSKRVAEKQLDYDNWNEPDEKVDRGTFEKANSETIKSRKIIVPHRKSNQTSSNKLGLFKSLDGFCNSVDSASEVKALHNDEFLLKLAALNKQFVSWISKHVSEDPYCILTPIFADYTTHLNNLESNTESSTINKSKEVCEKLQENASVKPKSTSYPNANSFPSSNKNFVFNFGPSSTTENITLPTTSTINTTAVPTVSQPAFSFGLFGSKDPIKPSISTSFFSNIQSNLTKNSVNSAVDQEDDEYVPPKPEVREIKEDDSVFDTRCKLFYKKADQWVERGLGNLYIKPTGDEKFQLLIRADTNLGNILLNIIVTKALPMQVQKNNLTFVCIPTPPVPTEKSVSTDANEIPQPVTMLIRVKTEEAAQRLLNEFNKYRGK